MSPNHTVLVGHTSKETAYIVDDYPYGFTLRCKIRYWIETKPKHGQRVVSQTTNPKRPGEVWNAPKPSTYSPIRVLYLNAENGHVENTGISVYNSTAVIADFEATYADGLTSERDQRVLRMLKAVAARQDILDAARHRQADPHCTCNDCVAYHAAQMAAEPDRATTGDGGQS